MRSKDRKTKQLLEYLSNPDNEFLPRAKLALSVLGYKRAQNLYKLFTPEDLTEIEKRALAERKKQMSRQLATAYDALTKQAASGNVQAIKELLDRIEGKVPTTITGKLDIGLGNAIDKARDRSGIDGSAES